MTNCLPVITVNEDPRPANNELIPLVLHLRRREPSSERAPQPALVSLPLPQPIQRPVVLPEAEELAIRGRLRVFAATGLRLRGLLETLRTSVFLATEQFSQARQTLVQWSDLFARLSHHDRQSHMDALAILLLRVIRPVLFFAENDSAEQQQALTWELELETIFGQLWPDVSFEAFIEECDDLMREEELINAQCRRLEHTFMVQDAVFAALETRIHAHIEHSFASVREQLITLQTARGLLNREAQVDTVVNRTNQVAQNLLRQANQIGELSRAITEQEELTRETLLACKALLERTRT